MAEGVRQFVKYSFYRVDPAWRRLPDGEREDHRRELEAVVGEFGGRMEVRSYTLVGLRADVDFLLWQVATDLRDVQEMATGVYRTGLGKYLTMPYSYLALTRRSPYVGGHRHPGQEGASATLRPEDAPYLVVYPFVKTDGWYQLSREERQGMMTQHFTIGHKYPGVHINTTYSFGLDDQDHVVSFNVTDLGEFLELVMEMRESSARPYTERDTPIFTCRKGEVMGVLESLG
jgi:chlorite dismutase